MDLLFFDSWKGIFRIAITTLFVYGVVIFMLRVSGKRTLAKMNAFDFIVTIALGSILASVILNKTVPIAEGLLAIALLISLQYGLTFLSVRNKKFKKIISNQPSLLYYRGTLYNDVLKKERIGMEEVHKSVREAGFSGFEAIDAVILETTGDITVISNGTGGAAEALQEVKSGTGI